MQQHPIPQNVTQYQFRLVGDMTLKQFLELALGLVLAWLFYASNLIFILKWPMSILSLLLGFGLAFFPIEERPLDQWITNFVKAIYQPTRFIWKKSFRLPSLFLFEPTPAESTITAVKTVKAPTLSRPQVGKSDLSQDESSRIAALDSLFGNTPTPAPATNPQPQSTNKPSIKVRKLSPASVIFDATKAVKPTPPKIPSVPTDNIPQPKPIAIPQADKTVVSSDTPTSRPSDPPISRLAETTPAPSIPVPKPITPTIAPQTINLPAPPKDPNIVVGMVVNNEGKMVENAIVQIVNNSGIPARAIKTNSLGQFYISTPLGVGDYAIEIEKDGLTFAPTKLTVKGDVIPPLLIKAS